MTEVFLIRHANAYDENGFQEPDTPLRGTGPKQATKLAKRLDEFKIESAYASPYKRAQQTAKEFSNKTGIPVITDERLKEIGTNTWTEKDFEKAKDFAEDVLLEIIAKNRNKKVALFIHGNLIKVLICKLLNANLEAYNNVLVISLASITTLIVEDTGQIKIVSISDNAHEFLL
jgi:broad specificity phosphatase PhoE